MPEEDIIVSGIISDLQRKMTSRGAQWATGTVTDGTRGVKCVFLPAVHELVSAQLLDGQAVFVKGRFSEVDAGRFFIAADVMAKKEAIDD